MSYYVLRRNADGSYVTPPGMARSYTWKLDQARVFTSRADAEREQCGNERVEMIDHILTLQRGRNGGQQA